MIEISDWIKSYHKLSSVNIHSPAIVEGTCKKVLGGRALYAKVELKIMKSNELKFSSNLSDSDYQIALEEDWLKAICLGVLDVMLVRPLVPITIFECSVTAITYHNIDSSFQAFRLAGRYAAGKFLEQEKFVTL